MTKVGILMRLLVATYKKLALGGVKVSSKRFALGIGFMAIAFISGAHFADDTDVLTNWTPQAIAEEIAPPVNIFAKISREETPAVVNISTKQKIKTSAMPPMADERMREFYERFFPGFKEMPREQMRQSLGSGFVVEEDGYILTNSHVVSQADEIIVTFGSGHNGNGEKEYIAKLIAADPDTDIALIKIKPDKKLHVLALGNSDNLQVGEWVIAIGNPFGFSQSVTVGVVSAKGRVIGAGQYDDFIQTDASINPGNSGGPLLNVKGEVIGINSAIYTGGQSQGNIGIGFAVPINTVKAIYEDLKKGELKRGWLGVSIQPVTKGIQKDLKLPSTIGALVSDVFPEAPAGKAGIKRYDVIVEFNGKEVPSSSQLPKMVAFLAPGTKVKVKIVRDGKEKTFTLKLGKKPDAIVRAPESQKSEDLGLIVTDLTPELAHRFNSPDKKGVIVSKVLPGGPAATAGIHVGDVIAEINRGEVKDTSSYNKAISKVEPGDSALLLIHRGKGTIIVTIKVPEKK